MVIVYQHVLCLLHDGLAAPCSCLFGPLRKQKVMRWLRTPQPDA